MIPERSGYEEKGRSCSPGAKYAKLTRFFARYPRALAARFREANRDGLLAVLDFVLARAHVVHLGSHFFPSFLAVFATSAMARSVSCHSYSPFGMP